MKKYFFQLKTLDWFESDTTLARITLEKVGWNKGRNVFAKDGRENNIYTFFPFDKVTVIQKLDRNNIVYYAEVEMDRKNKRGLKEWNSSI
ncbi:MAG: hypothetical protein AABY22_05130 [Nanoarchaeota archaeon]